MIAVPWEFQSISDGFLIMCRFQCLAISVLKKLYLFHFESLIFCSFSNLSPSRSILKNQNFCSISGPFYEMAFLSCVAFNVLQFQSWKRGNQNGSTRPIKCDRKRRHNHASTKLPHFSSGKLSTRIIRHFFNGYPGENPDFLRTNELQWWQKKLLRSKIVKFWSLLFKNLEWISDAKAHILS